MARMLHEDLLRQLVLIEETVKRIRSLVFSVKVVRSRPGTADSEAHAHRNIESLANECNLLAALFSNFVAALKEISSECEARLSLFRALPKQLQERNLTEYGTNKFEFLLGSVGTHAKELIKMVDELFHDVVQGTIRLKQDDISLVDELSQYLESSVIINIAALTKGISKDFANAIELQNALASETKAKPAGASLFSRLFGFKPAPAAT